MRSAVAHYRRIQHQSANIKIAAATRASATALFEDQDGDNGVEQNASGDAGGGVSPIFLTSNNCEEAEFDLT